LNAQVLTAYAAWPQITNSDHRERRQNLNFTEQQKSDLVAVLRSL